MRDEKHWHVCEHCSKEFGHEQPEGLTDPEFYDFHKCPTCKSGPYLRRYETVHAARLDAVQFAW